MAPAHPNAADARAVADHGALSAREALALRDEIRALRVAGAMLADMLGLSRGANATLTARVAELEVEVGRLERRYRDLFEAQRDLLRTLAAVQAHPRERGTT